MACEVIQVIRTDLERKGDGTGGNPFRRLTQYYTLDGRLLWEVDPHVEWQKEKSAKPENSEK